MFYNPKVYTPKPLLTNIELVPENKHEMYLKITHEAFQVRPDKETALSSKWTGLCRFWDNGQMYTAHHIAVNNWQPVPEGEVACWPGINWDTYYADDRQNLLSYLNNRYTALFGAEPRYDDEIGLWHIQVHYDGRCR